MSVVALKDYPARVMDGVEKFHGAQLLFVGWDQHLMFCSPFAWALPPTTPFKDLIEKLFPPAFGAHPDFAKIDWAEVEWFKSGQPWKPDLAGTLVSNGLKHKDALRFRTPGLHGLNGAAS